MRNFSSIHSFFTDKGATGAGDAFQVRDAKKIIIEIVGGDLANAVVKIQGALPERTITWGSAASDENRYSYIGFKTMEDRTVVDGGTGLTVGANTTTLIEVDAEALAVINVAITTFTAGVVSASAWAVLDL